MPDDETSSPQPVTPPPAPKRRRKSQSKRAAASKSKAKPRAKSRAKTFTWPDLQLPPHLKTTGILLLAAFILGAYISLYELKQPTEDEVEYRAMSVAEVPAESVTNLALDLPNAKLSFSRQDGVWRFDDQPIRADGERIQRILSSADPLRADRVMKPTPDQPLDPAAYGLEPPKGSITFVTGDKTVTVLLGEPTPVPGHRYGKLPDRADILVLPEGMFNDANQTAETFRDPLLVRFDIWSANKLSVSGKAPMELERVGAAWQLTQPVADQADRTEVNGLLTSLSQIKIHQYLHEEPVAVDRKKKNQPGYGLDKPVMEIALVLQGRPGPPGPDGTVPEPKPQDPVTIRFGGPLADDAKLIYAKRSDETALYAVEAGAVDALTRDPHGLRSKAVMEFFTNTVTKVEVTKADGAGWAAEKSDAGWITAGTSEALDTRQVDNWLSSLADMRLAGFVDDAPKNLKRYELDPPQATIAITTQDREAPQRLMIGSPVENSDNRHARIDGREAVVRLPGFITQLLEMKPEDFKTIIPAPGALPPSDQPL